MDVGLNETTDQLAMAKSVPSFSHMLMMEDGNAL